MKQAKDFIISGNVQGVGFRYFAQLTAADHHVAGWVQNLENGSVIVHAEGTAEQINSFIAALKRGNRFAKVHHVQEKSVPAQQLHSFHIKY